MWLDAYLNKVRNSWAKDTTVQGKQLSSLTFPVLDCHRVGKPDCASDSTTAPPPPASCGLVVYKGDGNCDDQNNNKGCEYDGGDCCSKTVKGGVVKKTFCTEVSYKGLGNILLVQSVSERRHYWLSWFGWCN